MPALVTRASTPGDLTPPHPAHNPCEHTDVIVGTIVTETLIGGAFVVIAGLRVEPGPLVKVLGVALQEPRSLRLFCDGLHEYLKEAHAFSASTLDVEAAKQAATGVGVLYGFAHGALSHQFELAARARTEEVEGSARALDTFLSLIPIPSTGKVVADSVLQGTIGTLPDLMIAASGALSHQAISDLAVEHRDRGRELLESSWAEFLATTPIDEITGEVLTDSLGRWYDVFGNAAGNPNPSGSFQVTPSDQRDSAATESGK